MTMVDYYLLVSFSDRLLLNIYWCNFIQGDTSF